MNDGTKCGYGKTCTPNKPHRGICPEDWHVPTVAEYDTLYDYVGGSTTAGSLLKSTNGWYGGGNGIDKYGFSVLPAGFRNVVDFNPYVFFFNDTKKASLWTASDGDNYYAQYQSFYDDKIFAGAGPFQKYSGQSLRCLKD